MQDAKICPLTLSKAGEQGSPCLREKCAWWIMMPARKSFASVTGEKEGICAILHAARKL